MGVRAALVVLLLFVAVAVAADGVTFWRKEFTMTCPGKGDWYDKENKLLPNVTSTTEYTDVYDNKKKGPYHCEYKDSEEDSEDQKKKYYFYVQGKACDNCFELDASLFLFIIIADIVGTVALMSIIFKCTKKKGPAGLTHTPKVPARPGGQASSGQSTYQELNPNTRSQETYTTVNRMG